MSKDVELDMELDTEAEIAEEQKRQQIAAEQEPPDEDDPQRACNPSPLASCVARSHDRKPSDMEEHDLEQASAVGVEVMRELLLAFARVQWLNVSTKGRPLTYMLNVDTNLWRQVADEKVVGEKFGDSMRDLFSGINGDVPRRCAAQSRTLCSVCSRDIRSEAGRAGTGEDGRGHA